MVIELAFYRCFFCGSRFSADAEARAGTFVHDWKVAVCLRCLAGHRQGVPKEHPAIKQLIERGLAVQHDGDGIVPWPGQEASFSAHMRPPAAPPEAPG